MLRRRLRRTAARGRTAVDRDAHAAGGPASARSGDDGCGLPGARRRDAGGLALEYGVLVACITAILLLLVAAARAGLPLP